MAIPRKVYVIRGGTNRTTIPSVLIEQSIELPIWAEPIVGAEGTFIEHCPTMFNEIQSYFVGSGSAILDNNNTRNWDIARRRDEPSTENRRTIHCELDASNAVATYKLFTTRDNAMFRVLSFLFY